MRPTLESLDREVRELRAELAITQTAIADLAASHACTKPDPDLFMAQWTGRVMGLAHAAAEGVRQTRVLPGIERMVQWAEEYLVLKREAFLVVVRGKRQDHGTPG